MNINSYRMSVKLYKGNKLLVHFSKNLGLMTKAEIISLNEEASLFHTITWRNLRDFIRSPFGYLFNCVRYRDTKKGQIIRFDDNRLFFHKKEYKPIKEWKVPLFLYLQVEIEPLPYRLSFSDLLSEPIDKAIWYLKERGIDCSRYFKEEKEK